MGFVIDIYKSFTCSISMKLKDFMSKVVENKRNGQLNTCLKKNKLKKAGISKDDLLNFNIDFKLKKVLLE